MTEHVRTRAMSETPPYIEHDIKQPPPEKFQLLPAKVNQQIANLLGSYEEVKNLRQVCHWTRVSIMPPKKAFRLLPVEIIHKIAHLFDSDEDVAHFAAACKWTKACVDDADFSFWRAKFRSIFALSPARMLSDRRHKSSAGLRKVYMRRRKALIRGVNLVFFFGNDNSEIKILEVLGRLIIESFSGDVTKDGAGRPVCPNQIQIAQFIRDSCNFLQIGRFTHHSRSCFAAKEGPTDQFAAIQLMCGHFLFEEGAPQRPIYCFEISQRFMYEPPARHPIVDSDGNVNMVWLLHCLNFFRYHMTEKEAESLFDEFRRLAPTNRPSAWRSKLEQGDRNLAHNWIGTYAYLNHNELDDLRDFDPHDPDYQNDFFLDRNVDEPNPFQYLKLDLRSQEQIMWPDYFEQHLRAAPQVSEDEKPGAFQFEAAGAYSQEAFRRTENEPYDFRFSGWMKPLKPQPKEMEIPGWHKVSFMKYCKTNDSAEVFNMWAYEGVLLPGGKIMLGRWWCPDGYPDDSVYSGPFILWAVDGDFAPMDWDLSSDEDNSETEDEEMSDGESMNPDLLKH